MNEGRTCKDTMRGNAYDKKDNDETWIREGHEPHLRRNSKFILTSPK